MTGQDIGVGGGRRRAAARAAAAVAITALAAAPAALTGCAAGGGHVRAAKLNITANPVHPARSASPGTGGPPGGTPVVSSAPATPSALPVAPPGVGSLPQTSAMPRTDDDAFGNAVHDIWLAVTTGDPDYALPAFFPEKAYEKVKAVGDPAADWQGRLWYDFTLDLAAAHKLVPRDATLVKVVVPAQYTRWIGPGACYNNVGYWNVPGARVVYRAGGVTRSFGIASFISWRGDWYLVHLGAEVRASSYGIVDDPEEGEGVPGPPGGC